MTEGLLKIMERIRQANAQSKSKIQSVESAENPLDKWLIFSISGKKFALPSVQVKEIINDVAVYHIPFVPDYIEGIMNRRGDPYTVIDPVILLKIETEENAQKNPLFLVLDIPNDQVCLHIENILTFFETEKEAAKLLKETKEFFKGTINFSGEEIPILNIDSFEKLIKKDLGNVGS